MTIAAAVGLVRRQPRSPVVNSAPPSLRTVEPFVNSRNVCRNEANNFSALYSNEVGRARATSRQTVPEIRITSLKERLHAIGE